MTIIQGPIVKKTVHHPEVVIPAWDERVFDVTAYWHLDYFGAPVGDGTISGDDEDIKPQLLYAKVAWPTLAAAQEQFRIETAAREAERAEGRRRTKEANARRRAARKAERS